MGIIGIAAGAHYFEGQQLNPYTITTQESHHYQLHYQGDFLPVWEPDLQPGKSSNDMVFFKLDPAESVRCGLTKVVLKTTLLASHCASGLIAFYPITDIEIAVCILWFIRG